MRIVGGILAGGQSSRMGKPKEGLILGDGRPMILHVTDALRPVVSKICILGECKGFDPSTMPEMHPLPDLQPGLGPMGGIHTLLESDLATHYLIVTCDQPRLTQQLLEVLAQNAKPNRASVLRTEGGEALTPFPCVIPASWKAKVADALARNKRSPRQLLLENDPIECIVPESAKKIVQSVNTLEEFDEFFHSHQASIDCAREKSAPKTPLLP